MWRSDENDDDRDDSTPRMVAVTGVLGHLAAGRWGVSNEPGYEAVCLIAIAVISAKSCAFLVFALAEVVPNAVAARNAPFGAVSPMSVRLVPLQFGSFRMCHISCSLTTRT